MYIYIYSVCLRVNILRVFNIFPPSGRSLIRGVIYAPDDLTTTTTTAITNAYTLHAPTPLARKLPAVFANTYNKCKQTP